VGSPSMLRMERINYMLGGVLIVLAALTQSRPVALGVAVGVVLTCLNFTVLRRLVTKWTSDAQKGQVSAAPMLMMPKMIGLMVAVALAIFFLPIDPIAFTVGYSIFIISIVIDTTYSAMRPDPEDGAPTTESDTHG
jgi:disulfide bond formation protein DsbB